MKKAAYQDKHFFQIRGVPGAGKTTIALIIKNLNPKDVFIVATDDFWEDEFDSDRASEAHEWCRKTTKKAMMEDDSWPIVIVHNTAAEYWEMEDYEQIAKESGYIYHRLIVEDHHGSGSTKENVGEKIRDYMERKFQIRLKTP